MATEQKSPLRIVGERLATEQEEAEHAAPAEPSVTLDVILLALRVLGQRTMAIASHAYPVLALGAAFALWWRVMETPSPYQLVGLGLFGVFLLALQMLRKGK